MPKDKITIIFGSIYCTFVISIWILLFSVVRLYSYYGGYLTIFYFMTFNGFIIFFGACFLVPSLILNLIFFISESGNTSGKVGFGLGVPGWVFCMIGSITGLFFWDMFSNFGVSTTIFALICSISLIVFGSLLFSRCYSDEVLATVSKTTRYPSNVSYARHPPQELGPPCPECNGATRYIYQYNRFYCDNCEKYV
ncbi:MAG: hypothetical protein ACTSRP_24600 [Candidatus Helarchaeota archaeon]